MQHVDLPWGDFIMKTALYHFAEDKIFTGNISILHTGAVVLAMILFACSAYNGMCEAAAKSSPASTEPLQASYIDEAELNAYREAKKEPDAQKRAAKLMEFYQKYPKSALMEAGDFDELRSIEAEYNAYYAARQEPDFDVRAAKLIEFIRQYPKSGLADYVTYEYVRMLKETAEAKKHEALISLAERWLKLHPNDRDIHALIADAAMNLKKYQKAGQSLEEIYKLQPTPNLAYEIHAAYEKAENLPKQLEWAEKLFKMPEFDSDYVLRYGYVNKFTKDNNLAKAAEYARLTLKSADSAVPKDAQAQQQLRKVRRACHHVIGSYLMEKGNFAEAIDSFKKAITIERYGQGYYKIGVCLENQKNIDEAVLYYAAAETIGEEDASRSKARLETLYKALHNNTLIGIDKVYKRAKEMLAVQ